MDLLFLLFILYLIFSAISRAVRAAGQAKKPPLPQHRETETSIMPDDGGALPHRQTDLPPWSELLFPGDPPVQQTEKVGQKTAQPEREYKMPAQESKAAAETMPKPTRNRKQAVSRFGRRNVTTLSEAPSLSVKQLIHGNNIRHAVVAAEILSAPRSKKPFFRR